MINIKHTLKILCIPLLLLIHACQSSLSEGKVDDLSLIGARIEVTQNLTDQKDNGVSIHLFDKDGRTIANRAIKIKVNNIDLDFYQRQELYYTTTTNYITSNMPVAKLYNFEIVLTNGKTYFLGKVTPLAEVNDNDIIYDKTGKFDQDFLISWKNLKEINELYISKGVKLKTSTELEQNYSGDSVITRQIKPYGSYIVPKSKYIDSISIISDLNFKFNALKSGRVNPDLVKDSQITISGTIEKSVDFDEESQEKKGR
ncbi:hypothetical protein [Pedobacter sp. MC2016-24]|uniref:hypothetical protein n=1 Tax=Pedobacter sp. MC2016-24 TaxID=2780090 RepID=UPI00188043A2|nr:hypothetical protein [Pedobacter sp. MC2016-24]MBE9598538.1 hypothetical protein [Pedobacter sp. MC2016-24]